MADRAPGSGDGDREHGLFIRTVATTSVVFLVSAVLGFLRDITITRYFGATQETDAFTIAWAVPETAYPVLVESMMLFALTPLFAQAIVREGTLRRAVGRSLPLVVATLTVLTGLVALLASPLVSGLAPGLARPELAVTGVRIAAMTVLFMGVAGYMTAALRVKERFAVTASIHGVYNLGIIAVIVALSAVLGIRSAMLGLVVGSALMVVVQAPSFLRRIGIARMRWLPDPALLRWLGPAVPIVLFSLARHGQVLFERFFASFLDPGSISHVNYAQKIAQVPMALVTTVAVVSFPALAQRAAAGDHRRIRQAIERDLGLVTFLILPATAVLVALAPSVVGLLFERGAFTASDTEATGAILRIYALGLVGQTAVNVAVLPFFSLRQHAPAALRAGLVGLGATVVADAALVRVLGAPGLAAGNAIGILVMAALLLRALRQRGLLGSLSPSTRRTLVHVAPLSVATALFAVAGRVLLDRVGVGLDAVVVPVVAGVALALYLGLAYAAGLVETRAALAVLNLGNRRSRQEPMDGGRGG